MHYRFYRRIAGMDLHGKLSWFRLQGRCLVGLLVFLVSLDCSSCSAFMPVMAVIVSLPDLPPAWKTADGWELDWRGMDTSGDPRLFAPGERLVLFLPRTSFAALRCKPVFGSSRGHPYGAIWPLDADDEGALSPSPGGGLSAELAFRLYQGGWDAALFNLRRFAREAELRMSDPWDSDFASLARAAAERRFRADYLRTPARFHIAVYGLPGLMAPDSPWGEVLKPDAQGHASLEAPTGIHRWFGENQELVVSVSSDGSSEWILRVAAGRVIEKVLP